MWTKQATRIHTLGQRLKGESRLSQKVCHHYSPYVGCFAISNSPQRYLPLLSPNSPAVSQSTSLPMLTLFLSTPPVMLQTVSEGLWDILLFPWQQLHSILENMRKRDQGMLCMCKRSFKVRFELETLRTWWVPQNCILPLRGVRYADKIVIDLEASMIQNFTWIIHMGLFNVNEQNLKCF